MSINICEIYIPSFIYIVAGESIILLLFVRHAPPTGRHTPNNLWSCPRQVCLLTNNGHVSRILKSSFLSQSQRRNGGSPGGRIFIINKNNHHFYNASSAPLRLIPRGSSACPICSPADTLYNHHTHHTVPVRVDGQFIVPHQAIHLSTDISRQAHFDHHRRSVCWWTLIYQSNISRSDSFTLLRGWPSCSAALVGWETDGQRNRYL